MKNMIYCRRRYDDIDDYSANSEGINIARVVAIRIRIAISGGDRRAELVYCVDVLQIS
jgi:hypothetical protein